MIKKKHYCYYWLKYVKILLHNKKGAEEISKPNLAHSLKSKDLWKYRNHMRVFNYLGRPGHFGQHLKCLGQVFFFQYKFILSILKALNSLKCTFYGQNRLNIRNKLEMRKKNLHVSYTFYKSLIKIWLWIHKNCKVHTWRGSRQFLVFPLAFLKHNFGWLACNQSSPCTTHWGIKDTSEVMTSTGLQIGPLLIKGRIRSH